MTALERIGKALDATVLGGNRDSWTRHLVVALFPRFMLSFGSERFERQNASGSLYARRSETCMLCLIKVR
jgi:hypothetical protein